MPLQYIYSSSSSDRPLCRMWQEGKCFKCEDRHYYTENDTVPQSKHFFDFKTKMSLSTQFSSPYCVKINKELVKKRNEEIDLETGRRKSWVETTEREVVDLTGKSFPKIVARPPMTDRTNLLNVLSSPGITSKVDPYHEDKKSLVKRKIFVDKATSPIIFRSRSRSPPPRPRTKDNSRRNQSPSPLSRRNRSRSPRGTSRHHNQVRSHGRNAVSPISSKSYTKTKNETVPRIIWRARNPSLLKEYLRSIRSSSRGRKIKSSGRITRRSDSPILTSRRCRRPFARRGRI